MARVYLALLLVPLTLGACFRYRTLSHAEAAALCPAAPEASRPVTVIAQGPTGSVTGTIVDATSGTLVPLGRVRLLAADGGIVAIDSQVERRPFVLTAVVPGSHSLDVVGLAYRPRRVALQVPRTGGVTVRIPLDRQATDECPGFMAVEVRRPWWQWWYPP